MNNLNEKSREFLISEIEKYLNGGFGSMNKNDFEVLIFTALQISQEGNGTKTNYALSRSLRVPESKIKRLKYESDLKFNQSVDGSYDEQKFEQLDNLLKTVILKEDGKKIQFVIEDPSLRKFLDYILKENHRFSDSSFNSEVVKLTIEDLECILSKSSLAQKKIKQIREEALTVTGENFSVFDAISSIIKSVSIGSVSLNIDAIANSLRKLLKKNNK